MMYFTSIAHDSPDENPPEETPSRLEALGSAAAGIAHDMNNELTLLLNYLSVTNVEEARAAAARCSALTASLLSYCRGGGLDLRRMDPSRFLREFARHLALPESVRLHLEIPEALPPILADGAALTRVLDNLVSNARYAMRDSGRITVRASELTIQVEDSGPGIDPALTKRIFDPFFSTKGAGGNGTGPGYCERDYARAGRLSAPSLRVGAWRMF